MGISTKIKNIFGKLAENPFRDKNCLDLAEIKVSLVRIVEKRQKNILGRVLLPDSMATDVIK
jgi:hypothetical protein